MLRGEWRNVAAKIIDFGVSWIVPHKVRLVGQFLPLERILEECELEGGCGILRVLQTAGEPGHYCDTRWLYLGGSDERVRPVSLPCRHTGLEDSTDLAGLAWPVSQADPSPPPSRQERRAVGAVVVVTVMRVV